MHQRSWIGNREAAFLRRIGYGLALSLCKPTADLLGHSVGERGREGGREGEGETRGQWQADMRLGKNTLDDSYMDCRRPRQYNLTLGTYVTFYTVCRTLPLSLSLPPSFPTVP